MKRLTDLPSRDLELLSAYLDKQLEPRHEKKLLARLEREPDLRWALDELSRTVAIVRTLPEVRPPRSFTLTTESAGIRVRSPAYPILQLATALATLAFVAVVGLDTLARSGGPAALAPAAPEQAERLAAQQVEETAVSAPSEEVPAFEMTEPEEAPQTLSGAPPGSPTPLPTAAGIGGGGPPVTLPSASEPLSTAQPDEAAEDRAFAPSGTPCIGCGGGEAGETEPGEPPMIAQAPPQATAGPATIPTEATTEKIGEAPVGGALANAPTALSQPSSEYRSGLTLIRLAEISLGLAAVIMAALTLWVRRTG